MTPAFVIGYDPGGNGAHGLAALTVRPEGGRWMPLELQTGTADTVADAVAWVEAVCRDGRIVAAGADTLTEWNSGHSGWRPADLWLRRTYPAVALSIVPPNSIYGSMTINGAAFLTLLGLRFRADGTMVTEAHPKVLYHALVGRKPSWQTDGGEMTAWLAGELGVELPAYVPGSADHRFDAAMAVLAALRGLDREWTLDLHALPEADPARRVPYCGETHYWWPDPSGS